MMQQKQCPFCMAPASDGCEHLAVAAEGRDFVRRCVESCHGEKQWRAVCARRHLQGRVTGEWCPEQEDYTWLETAFCEEFLKGLRWFGGMEHEWRAAPNLQQGGFWVLLWSKDPQRLWWELRDEFERQSGPRQSARFDGAGPRATDPRSRSIAGGTQTSLELRAWRD